MSPPRALSLYPLSPSLYLPLSAQTAHARNHQPPGRYGAVIRGDQSNIVVGTRSSIGDRTVVQSCAVNPTGYSARTYIGSHVVIGKGCVLRGCTVDSGSMVGDGCIIQEGAVVESGAYLAPGSVLPVGALVPSGKIYAGNPATYVKDLDGEVDFAEEADEMMELSRKNMVEYLPYSTAWRMYETHVKEGSVEVEGPKAKAAREGE